MLERWCGPNLGQHEPVSRACKWGWGSWGCGLPGGVVARGELGRRRTAKCRGGRLGATPSPCSTTNSILRSTTHSKTPTTFNPPPQHLCYIGATTKQLRKHLGERTAYPPSTKVAAEPKSLLRMLWRRGLGIPLRRLYPLAI